MGASRAALGKVVFDFGIVVTFYKMVDGREVKIA
jgi:hypothetical protein